ncbi:ABC transporter ATP-binding protein [Vagococcus sp. BWB3-3]|uniref:ABC transporter ATP-binding protein n=1 Tax=Vagococcus allomyrinae TaxID=2794353 RepID=A0A940STS3_9ENTE|nr:ABC transporter ATP-binding protein [Vagococcus allomyrinae]MBP1040004.1 ABC transporter ATP-binding protein [Vagococcus allomyrinae]
MTQDLSIKVKELKKSFKGTTAIKDISFTVGKGEIFGFLGPSGAGKTTTIKILTGQLKQTSGHVEILGQNITNFSANLYERIGIMTDNSGLYERMTVYQNLAFFARLLQVPTSRVDELLQRVGLAEHQKKLASKLSKGMTQRLILARAVLHQPELLFLDEPTSGLDPSTASAIHELLLELRDNGTAILLTTHNMEEATFLCDNIALLNDGFIVERGTPEELKIKFNQEKRYRITKTSGQQVVLADNHETVETIQSWFQTGQIETIHSCEPTLGDIFIQVTGRKLV